MKRINLVRGLALACNFGRLMALQAANPALTAAFALLATLANGWLQHAQRQRRGGIKRLPIGVCPPIRLAITFLGAFMNSTEFLTAVVFLSVLTSLPARWRRWVILTLLMLASSTAY